MRFDSIRTFLIRIKLYITRTNSYIGIVNSILILFLFLSDLKKYGIYITIKDWLIPLALLWVFLMILFGFLEERFGFFSEEQKLFGARNPHTREILARLDRIEKKLGKKR
jgi:hypothetical protein